MCETDMLDPNEHFLRKGLGALSTMASIATLVCAVFLFAFGPAWPNAAATWLEGRSRGLRAQISGLNEASEKHLAAVRQRLFEIKAERQQTATHHIPKTHRTPNKPPTIASSWLSEEFPEAVWTPLPLNAKWSQKEIATGLKKCLEALAPLQVVVEPLPPIREGPCGMAAPVRLKRLGQKTKVSVNPPAIIDCQMVAGLDHWIEDAVQPAARATFGLPVTQIVGSSYACRNIYNRDYDRLSQHAFGNAFDLPTFVLANGRRIHIVLGWGPTARDETPRLVPVVAKTETPVDDSEKNEEPPKTDAAEAKFLRRVHKAACSVFSTVLGPEINDAHRNHLHLDLQDRGSQPVCR
jgi:hypothetical protein